jgi:hypothetical protein
VLSTTNKLFITLNFKTMKKTKIIFWVTTVIIFLFEGVLPALTSQTELAKEGIRHLGYPAYFGNLLVVFKVAGAVALIIPQVPKRIKEWAYAGFGFDFIAAAVSHTAIDGFGGQAIFPIVFMGLLILSYFSYRQLLNITSTPSGYHPRSAFKTELSSAS